MCQCLVAGKNYTLVRFISESNQSKESKLIETGTKRRQKATSYLSKKLLLLCEVPYMLKHRCCQSVKSPIVLAIRTFSFYQDTHIFFSMTSVRHPVFVYLRATISCNHFPCHPTLTKCSGSAETPL